MGRIAKKLGRPDGTEYFRIHEDIGCVAAPKCLECPEPKCLEDMTFAERHRWSFQHKPKPLRTVEPPNKGKYGWRLEDFAARCNAGEVHVDREWAEIYSVSSNLISTWRHKMRKRGLLTV